MIKLSKKEISKILDRSSLITGRFDNIIQVYHYHEWDHGYYGHTGYGGTRREFYHDYWVMQEFLRKYTENNHITNVIISPLHLIYYFNWDYKTIKKYDDIFDIYSEVTEFFKKNNLDVRYESGLRLKLDDSWNIIDALCEGAYLDVINICLLFEENSTVFEPHHHMNFNIYVSDRCRSKQLHIIRQTASLFPQLRCYAENVT